MRTIYRYIYVPGPVIYRPGTRVGLTVGGARAQAQSLLSELLGMIAAAKSPDQKATLKKLHELMAKVTHLLGDVPSAKLRATLVGQMNAAMATAQNGDAEGALGQMMDTLSLATQMVDKGHAVKGAIATLKSLGGSLPGAGQRAVNEAVAAAEDAMKDASSLHDMNSVESFLQAAVANAQRMQAAPPDSSEFNFYLAQLEGATKELKANPRGTDMLAVDTRMSADALALSSANRRYADHVGALADKTTDHFERQGLLQLKQTLNTVGERIDHLPGDAFRQAVLAELGAIMDQANGQALGEANQAAMKLLARIDRAGTLDHVVAAKFDRGEAIAGRLKGPAAAALRRVLDAARAARARATTPEELEALDGQLLGAMFRAERVGALSPEAASRAPALQELLTLASRLEAKQPPGAKAPALATDVLDLSSATRGTGTLPPRGTSPLAAPPAGRLPNGPSGTLPAPAADATAQPTRPTPAPVAEPAGPPRQASGEIDFAAIYRSAPLAEGQPAP